MRCVCVCICRNNSPFFICICRKNRRTIYSCLSDCISLCASTHCLSNRRMTIGWTNSLSNNTGFHTDPTTNTIDTQALTAGTDAHIEFHTILFGETFAVAHSQFHRSWPIHPASSVSLPSGFSPVAIAALSRRGPRSDLAVTGRWRRVSWDFGVTTGC